MTLHSKSKPIEWSSAAQKLGAYENGVFEGYHNLSKSSILTPQIKDL